MTARWRQHLPYAALLLVGALARCAELGVRPLAASEAVASWTAWTLATGGSPAEGVFAAAPDSGSLLGLQTLLFWFFSGDDAAARVVPAIVGSLIVVVPWALRTALGRVESITLAALLASDPLFVGYSRLADGTAVAVAAIWTAVICLWVIAGLDSGNARANVSRSAWIAVAIGATSGPVFWDLLPPFVALSAMLRAARGPRPPLDGKTVVVAVIAAIVVASSGLTQWSGPQLWSVGATAWLRQWSEPSGVALGELWRTMTRFEMVGLTLGAAGVMAALVSSRSKRFGTLLLLCVMWGVMLTLRPGRTPAAWFALQLPLFLATASMAPLLAARAARLVAQRAPLRSVAAAAAVLLALQVAGAAAQIATDERASRFRAYADETLPSIRVLVEDLRAWRTLQHPANVSTRIEIASPRASDPVLAWYLRDHREVRFVGAPSAAAPLGHELRLAFVTDSALDQDASTYPIRRDLGGVLRVAVR